MYIHLNYMNITSWANINGFSKNNGFLLLQGNGLVICHLMDSHVTFKYCYMVIAMKHEIVTNLEMNYVHLSISPSMTFFFFFFGYTRFRLILLAWSYVFVPFWCIMYVLSVCFHRSAHLQSSVLLDCSATFTTTSSPSSLCFAIHLIRLFDFPILL